MALENFQTQIIEDDHQPLSPELEHFNLREGDTVINKQGTRRVIEKIDLENGEITTQRIRKGEVQPTKEHLNFKLFNLGVADIERVEHSDGQIDFKDIDTEIKHLEESLKKYREAFTRGDTMLNMGEEIQKNELLNKRLQELKAQLENQ
ncbi:MAG: hypothetical protein COX02_02545 [Candidatus Vogelbacteria bacterium CG22_combo_CG10-13_8_21_14_all_37_9]|uniref:Uncharacterized protein n=1 Tax=Candidatus Vogelbacteria bacterium CG22_combo_CG10-13_8_21_14_all_37_9 TaxID=1975046 RepID=A0A2H0BK11_9BACT|nr:MAG: hypothetical protein BK005_01635 [bacterium CG10_37_50]PIP58007.1 MAG: hypothetical protein COX02_02545 [Candidatus Vogelbacteria bacterium CG22_combo_CG10-13_8_21_14_all_37_9]